MSNLTDGSRAVAASLSGFRRDHVARYEWAAKRLSGKRVLDAGCGAGYGSAVLASQGGCRVDALDLDPEAVQFAQQNWNHDDRITYDVADIERADLAGEKDAVVAFEVLEHLQHPERALRRFHGLAPRLLCSVPNEDVSPFRPEFLPHMRHYRKHEFEELLSANGWNVVEWWGQEGLESEVEKGVEGQTLVAVAERVDEVAVDALAPRLTREDFKLPGKPLPESVAIVAMGMSSGQYLTKAMQAGGREGMVDEVWAINNAGGVVRHDRLFHMDDFQIQRSRAELRPDSALAELMRWLPDHDHPVYTPRAYEWAESSVEYPLEWVLNQTGHCYFNNTVPYALAFALALGVKHIHLFGCDYGYPDDQAYKREKGRACLEYWIAVAAEKHVTVHIPEDSTLLDAVEKNNGEVFYGYDTEWVRVGLKPGPIEEGGGFQISRVERRPEDIPTAKQMEVRYSHDTRFDHREQEV